MEDIDDANHKKMFNLKKMIAIPAGLYKMTQNGSNVYSIQ
jgi:hypothetical protein